jgi:hypothetical protein
MGLLKKLISKINVKDTLNQAIRSYVDSAEPEVQAALSNVLADGLVESATKAVMKTLHDKIDKVF